MGILEKLLETDPEKISKREMKQNEIKRLSKLLGEPFLVECRPLTSEQFEHIGEISKSDEETRKNTVLEACRLEGKKLGCKELREKFAVETGVQVLDKLFLIGEVSALYQTISKMSGYGTNVIEEIKN